MGKANLSYGSMRDLMPMRKRRVVGTSTVLKVSVVAVAQPFFSRPCSAVVTPTKG
jgi:hypothetical protein